MNVDLQMLQKSDKPLHIEEWENVSGNIYIDERYSPKLRQFELALD